jgi:hypothetical protein
MIKDALSAGQLDGGNVFAKFGIDVLDASLNERYLTNLPAIVRSDFPRVQGCWPRKSPV